jgi:colicin import membrane protein
MRNRPNKIQHDSNMMKGLVLSFILHSLGIGLSLLVFSRAHANLEKDPVVFTVTIEGGEVLGGVGKVPTKGKETEKLKKGLTPEEALEVKQKKEEVLKEKEVEQKKEEVKTEPVPEKELEKPSLVEEVAKRKLEKELQDKKIEEEKKKIEDKKVEEQKKKEKEEEKKKKIEEDQKKKIQEEIKNKQKEAEAKEKEKKDRDKRLSDLARQIKSKQYEGESVNAGGEGFGAARLGGQAGGGGTLAPYAKVAYQNELQEHVKAGWRWMLRTDRLRTLVRVKIEANGNIADVRIEQSSGNSNFDDSVVRAVRKASPVPAPPKEFFNDFSDVRFWFDSQDQ